MPIMINPRKASPDSEFGGGGGGGGGDGGGVLQHKSKQAEPSSFASSGIWYPKTVAKSLALGLPGHGYFFVHAQPPAQASPIDLSGDVM